MRFVLATFLVTVLCESSVEFLLLNVLVCYLQEFLQSLDPPLVIRKETLTRWHPEFAVDQVPDVPACDLPQPPNFEKCCSAKDVLGK